MYSGYTVPYRLDGSPVEVERVSIESLTPQSFFDLYVGPRKPVVIESSVLPLDTIKLLTDYKYLKSKAGEEVLNIEHRKSRKASFGKGSTEPMTFGTFLDRMEEGNEDLYLTSQPLDMDSDGFSKVFAKPLTSLSSSLPLPPALTGYLVPQQVNLWMGNTKEGSSSGLHHDYHDNLYLLLKGKKVFTLFSPKDAKRMYTVGKISTVHRNGRINYEGYSTNADGSDEDVIKRLERLELLVEIAKAEKEVEELEGSGGEKEVKRARSKLQGLEKRLGEMMGAMIGDEGEGEGDFEDDYVDSDEERPVSKAAADNVEKDSDPPSFSVIDYAASNGRPSHKAFPLFASASPAVAEVSEGEMLFLPAGWFHEVRSYSTIATGPQDCGGSSHQAINYWYHPPSTKEYRFPYGEGKSNVWGRLWEARGLPPISPPPSDESPLKVTSVTDKVVGGSVKGKEGRDRGESADHPPHKKHKTKK